ncbi:MAG: hypothetical protein ACXW1R_05420 [Halobacteriota archaeon]
MDISAYIGSAVTAFQKVIKPLFELFKLKSEVATLRLENQELKKKVRDLEQRCKELEAPGEAKKLGYELCHCTTPPQIMNSIAHRVFVCPRCNNKVNLNATVAFSD